MPNYSDIPNVFSEEKWSLLMKQIRQVNNEYQTLFSCLLGIIFVIGFFGNSLTCFIIWRNKTMHTATNCYLFNLAVSDLLLTLAMISEIIDIYKPTTNTLNKCRLSWFIVIFLWNNGTLTITALSIERFIAICYPFMLHTTGVCRRVRKIIFLLWVVAIVETTLEIMTVGVTKTYDIKDDMLLCLTHPTPATKVLYGVLAIITYVIPLMIIAFAYSMIAYKVNTTRIQSPGDQVFNQVGCRSKTNKLVIAVTLSFLMCWMPFFIAKMLFCVFDADQFLYLTQSWSTWYFVVIMSGWMSVVLNPILYNLMSRKFRMALKVECGYLLSITATKHVCKVDI